MVTSLPILLLIGTLLGFLSGIGVGGGSLLILWLTVIIGMDHSTARQINLLFFIPSALTACFFRWKQGSINLKRVFPAAVCGCVAAAVCSRIGQGMDNTLVEKIFGGLLILTGLRELFSKKKKAGDQNA